MQTSAASAQESAVEQRLAVRAKLCDKWRFGAGDSGAVRRQYGKVCGKRVSCHIGAAGGIHGNSRHRVHVAPTEKRAVKKRAAGGVDLKHKPILWSRLRGLEGVQRRKVLR